MSYRFLILLLVAVLGSACGPTPGPATQASPVPPTPTPAADQRLAREAWQSSPHANTYDEGKGPNTYCARCHSPLNWDPAAVVDPAPNCVSCKFAFDPQMRIAKGNPPVAKEVWKNIGCEVCHLVKNGVTDAAPTWLDARSGYHETVASSTALCGKCHANTATLRHARELGTEAHAKFECSDCHDAHSTAASCTATNCHATPTTRAGHDSAHAKVECAACHDAAKMEVGPQESAAAGMSEWVVYRTTELMGRKTKAAYQSHNLQKTVDCGRCHFAGNAWKLSVQSGGTR